MMSHEMMSNATDIPWETFNTSLGILPTNLSMVTSLPDDVSTDILSNVTKKVIAQVPTTRKPQFNKRCGLLYQYIIRGVLLGVIIIFGVVGNILSILVMRHDIHTSATSLLFFVLAVVDMIVLLTRAFVICIPNWLAYWNITSREYNRFHRNYVEAYGEAFAFLAQHWTTGMTVLVTVHRYMVVCRPTSAAKLASIKAVRIQMVVMLIAIAAYNMPLFFQYTVTERIQKWSGNIIWRKSQTEMASTDSYSIGYRIVMLYIMIYAIPVCFLVILSYRLVVTVKKAAEKMKNTSNRSQDKQDMTKTLVSIIIVYMICQLPTPTNILITEFTPRQNRRCPYAYFYFRDFDDVGICFNSAFNFVLYCLFGKRFRRHLKSILCGHKLRIEALGATLEMSHSTRNDMSAENANLHPVTASTITATTSVGEQQNGKVVATTHK